jgi:hypothetical protein
MNTNDKPWATMGDDSVTVKLSRPTVLNGVKQDKIVIRVPTVGDLRAAAKHGKDDVEEQDVFLFASLADCAPSDIERLSVRDYNRIKDCYFRMVSEDDGPGPEVTGKAAGD